MTTTLSPTESLKKTVCDYKFHIAQIAALQKDTVKCLEEIQNLINLGRTGALFSLPALQIPELDFGNRMPCVLFIGSQNCGKSTLLNVFLRKHKLLPRDETPCTARLVRIVYSPENYKTLVDPQGNKQEIIPFETKVSKKLIVLKNDDRQDIEKLKTIVEVGLNHELLECGIELIDSPGRNENDALDRVVEEFVEKGIVPLIVYIVDGNNQLQQMDRTTIRQLQSKFPNVSLMFVCSKVDVDKKAKAYDNDEDTDDESCETDAFDEQLFNEAQKKKLAVFQKLKDLDFLPSDTEIESSIFHGISAETVEKAREENIKNAATMSFDRLELCILEKLESSLRRESKRVLSTLMSAQEMILSSVVDKQRTLAAAVSSLPEAYEYAVKMELSVFSMILDLIVKGQSITNTIGSVLEKLAVIFLKEGEDYQFNCNTMNDSKEELVDKFCHEMKGAILDRAFNVLKRSIRQALRQSLFQSIEKVEKITEVVGDPLISRLMQRIYANEYQQKKNRDKKDFLGVYVVLEGVLESFRNAVDSALRKEIFRQLNEFNVEEVGSSQPRPRDSSWRRKVVQTLLSKIDCKLLTKEVVETCKGALSSKHQQFTKDVRDFRSLNKILSAAGVESTIKRLRSDYVPQVAELAVKGHALQYVIERGGPPELGEQITCTAHGQVYSCYSPLWCADRDSCVVKVITKSAVGVEVWNQTMRDCMHTLDIVEKLGEYSPHLLQLNGWFMPEPDQLYIVMEGAEEDLLTALKRGMSWQKRIDVAVDVARGVAAIHKVKYIYQDLKPQNVMLTADGTAKVNLCKPEKPFEVTKLGIPFHISPRMFLGYGKDYSRTSFDIYAFGSLLWVLCEGSGQARPQAYSHCNDIETMKAAVCEKEIRSERPPETPDALWVLMSSCWSDPKALTIETVVDELLIIQDTSKAA